MADCPHCGSETKLFIPKHPAKVPVRKAEIPASEEGMVTAGWICAIIMPVVGIIMGIILISKKEPKGNQILIGSVISIAIWGAILASLS